MLGGQEAEICGASGEPHREGENQRQAGLLPEGSLKLMILNIQTDGKPYWHEAGRDPGAHTVLGEQLPCHGSQEDTASVRGVKLVQANGCLDQSYPSLKVSFKGAGRWLVGKVLAINA